MDDLAREQAWREYCNQLGPLGVDPYSPEVGPGDPRHPKVQAIIAEYDAALGKPQTPSLPASWEGTPPLDSIRDLADIAGWLKDQWHSVLATEMGGEKYRDTARDQAARAIRNAFRLLGWMGVEDPPIRPMPPTSLEVAKSQIDDLERWVRHKHRSGWKPSLRLEREINLPVPSPPATTPSAPSVVLNGPGKPPIVLGKEKKHLTPARYNVVQALLKAGANGLSKDLLDEKSGHREAHKILKDLHASDPDWEAVIDLPGTRGNGYRILS